MQNVTTSPYITAALITGAISLVLLFLKSIYDSLEKTRQYRERRNDMQKAIYAEISAFVKLQEKNQPEIHGEKVAQQILNEGFKPFLIREKYNAVYEALMDDIHYLPVDTIDIITRFYQRLSIITEMKEAMMSASFSKLNDTRRALVYRHYIATLLYALEEGREALALIEIFSKGGSIAVNERKSALAQKNAEQSKLEVKAWIESQNGQ